MGASGKLRRRIQKNNQPPPSNTTGLAAQVADPEQQGKVDPGKIRQLEDVTAMFMRLIHGEETRKSVLDMLKSNPEPSKAIVGAANSLMKRVETQTKKRRMTIPNDIKVASAQYLVSDLAALGNKAGAWDRKVSQEELGPILQATMQFHIRAGIRDKTIDVPELQREVGELMNEEQTAIGLAYGEKTGIPPQGTAVQGIEQYKDQEVEKALHGRDTLRRAREEGADTLRETAKMKEWLSREKRQ